MTRVSKLSKVVWTDLLIDVSINGVTHCLFPGDLNCAGSGVVVALQMDEMEDKLVLDIFFRGGGQISSLVL